MQSDDNLLNNLFLSLTSAEVLTEVIAVLIVTLVALASVRMMKAWHANRAAALARSTAESGTAEIATGWHAAVLEGTALATPVLLAMVLLLVIRSLLGFLNMHTAVVDAALQLATALLIVRVAVYILRILLGPGSWVARWENRVIWIVWLLVGFQLIGWFSAAETTLDTVDLIPGKTQFSLWALLKGIVVVTGFVVVTSLVARTIERRVMKLDALAISTRIGISKFAYFFLLSVGVLLGVNAAGVDVTTLNVLTGAIGLGLGFGLQAIASNFVSGFVLLMDKSIKPGDVISFTGTTGTSTENFGWVQELRGRYVVVRDRDGVETLVPNQNLITNSVINWSYSDQRVRIRLPVMVSYDSDVEHALQVLLEAARNHPRILREPAPVTRLMSFENYGMRLEVRFWIADPMNGVNNVRSDVNRAIWKVFKDNGIKIPVNQSEIRVIERLVAPRGFPSGDEELPRSSL